MRADKISLEGRGWPDLHTRFSSLRETSRTQQTQAPESTQYQCTQLPLQWLMQTLCLKDYAKQSIRFWPMIFMEESKVSQVYSQEQAVDRPQSLDNIALFNFICRQKLRHPSSAAVSSELEQHYKELINKLKLSYKNRFMLFSCDPDSFAKIPYQQGVVQVEQKQHGRYLLSSGQLAWLCSFTFGFKRWRQINCLKILPPEQSRTQFEFSLDIHSRDQLYTQLARHLDREQPAICAQYLHSLVESLPFASRPKVLTFWVALVVQAIRNQKVIRGRFEWVSCEDQLWFVGVQKLQVQQLDSKTALDKFKIEKQKLLQKRMEATNPLLFASQGYKQKLLKFQQYNKTNQFRFQQCLFKMPVACESKSQAGYAKIRPDTGLSLKQLLNKTVKEIRKIGGYDSKRRVVDNRPKANLGLRERLYSKAPVSESRSVIKQILRQMSVRQSTKRNSQARTREPSYRFKTSPR